MPAGDGSRSLSSPPAAVRQSSITRSSSTANPCRTLTAPHGEPSPAKAGPCGSGIRGEGAYSVAEILTEPVSAPSVWRGDELTDSDRWIVRFTDEDFADFERALAHVSKKQFEEVTEIQAE